MTTPFIIGLNNTTLSKSELKLIPQLNPLGIILFKRNIESIEQTKSLIQQVKHITSNQDLLILIDEEGGKVSRTNHIFDDKIIAAYEIGELYAKDPQKGLKLLEKSIMQIINRLKSINVNSCCHPVCDLYFPEADDVIGSRSFSSNPEIVIELANKSCEIFLKNQILPIIKHIPGHGRANIDSHKDLPIIKTEERILMKSDFYIFQKLAHMPIAMTAHIIYDAIDRNLPITTSKIAIKYLREKIKFNNFLISDDICMNALKGSLKTKILDIINSNCDIILHCNGNLIELEEIIDIVKNLKFIKKFDELTNLLKK